MKKSIVFMFSGQGSQYYNMGKELYLHNTAFRDTMLKLDKIFHSYTGKSVLEVLYCDKRNSIEAFDELFYTHPAIFMVEYSLANMLAAMGIYPDIVLGASLGEFTASAVAGILSCEDIMECLIKQVQIFENLCEKGGMLSIIGDYKLFNKIAVLNENSELVAVNYDSHFVVSGSEKGISTIQKYLKNNGIIYQRLPVKFPFHSALIEPSAAEFTTFLNTKEYKIPSTCFISCVTGTALSVLDKDYFWEVARRPIRFQDAINFLDKDREYIYVDLGPSGTLANFCKNILGSSCNSSIFSIITPFGKDSKNLDRLYENMVSNKILANERKRDDMLAYVFPGQGSQSKGMGGALFDEFMEVTSEADEILGYSIKELCLEDPDGNLGHTQYTQPALYVVNILSYLKKLKEDGLKPDYVAGHSLGEYCALFAAGVFDFKTGLKIVKKRGELMSQAKNGGMAAVVGASEEKIKEIFKENGIDSIDIANYNTPSQIVISGPKEDIINAQKAFVNAGVMRYLPLAVSGAFHSRYMEVAKREFEKYINQFEFSKPNIPVISNFTARAYKESEIKRNMVEQITGSVKWCESMRVLMGKGDISIQQIGPGTALTGMLRGIQKEAEPLIIEEEAEASNVKEIQETLPKVQEPKAADRGITAFTIGSKEFKNRYGLKYAYLTGGMYRGVSSREMVVKVGKAGMMGFLGTGGFNTDQIEADIKYIQRELNQGQAYGVNFLSFPSEPSKEEEIADLYMRNNVKIVEASAFMSITAAIVKYRLKGLRRDAGGAVVAENRIIAKISRPETAQAFLSPAPERIVEKLLASNKITREQAELSKEIAMADDITVEADSGGHTDGGVAYALMPAIIKLRNDICAKYGYKVKIGVGAAGGIGTPEAAASAFVLGADYIVTGSINQCTVEAATSDSVKDLLQNANVQDTEYAPAGDMFEIGSKVQVLKKGLFFPARANKLYELYRQYNSLDEIDEKTKKQLEERYFKKTFNQVFDDLKAYYPIAEIEKCQSNPKHKMALVFRWYFNRASRLALEGDSENKVDYQIHCGPALGAFNQWVKETPLEGWRNRHVDEIGIKLMNETADFLKKRFDILNGI